MINSKTIILTIVVVVVIGSIFYLQSRKTVRRTKQIDKDSKITVITNKKEKIKQYEPAKEITTPDGFINVDSISISEFIGKKVVLVDFWTYSCINCQRTLPYLNAWHEKYKDKGLVIIGVHTPEFKFEQKYENVLAAVKKFSVQYPVVLDNDYSTWTAYRNRWWPRKYLIDIDGFIVYDHIGEGNYDETEREIQKALAERSMVLNKQDTVDTKLVNPEGVEVVDTSKKISPEIYFGAARNEYLGNGKSGAIGTQIFTAPADIKTDILYLVGEWNFTEEFAENKSPGAKIIFRYQAEKVFLVATSEQDIKLRILHDGVPLSSEAGKNVEIQNGESTVTVKGDELYRLIENSVGHSEHTLEIIIENSGLRVFAFTFALFNLASIAFILISIALSGLSTAKALKAFL